MIKLDILTQKRVKPQNVRKHVDSEDNGVTIRDSIGREQTPVCINESGLYSLILSSKLPSAKQFKRWVASEVLPELRKTGGYSVQNLTGLSPETVALMKATEALVMIEKKQNERYRRNYKQCS
nr:BRO family protein [Eubacterium maltosivorans]